MSRKFFILSISIFLSGCYTHKNKSNVQSQKIEIISTDRNSRVKFKFVSLSADSILTYDAEFQLLDTSNYLVIRTKFLCITNKYLPDDHRVISQDFNFFKNETLTTTIKHGLDLIIKPTSNTGFLRYTIYDVGSFKYKGDEYYSFIAVDGKIPENEYNIIFNTSGNIVCYTDCNSGYCDTVNFNVRYSKEIARDTTENLDQGWFYIFRIDLVSNRDTIYCP